jgi:ribosomal protein S18 acetylase RimI-like enzyme
VRLATPDEVDDLVELIESAYRGDRSRRGWTTEADLVGGRRTDHDEVARAVAGPGSCLLAAELDRALVGCCRLETHQPGLAELGLFAVRPALQGAGVGRTLVGAAEAEVARRWGATTMRLHVISQRHELVAWYRRLGYRPTGRTAPFPASAAVVPLRPGLHFSVLEKELGSPTTGR